MYASFEEKGKIYTNIITKTPVNAIIQTTRNRIEGKVHVRTDDRLKDELSQSDCFLAVTDATVFGEDGQVLYATRFLSVHRDHVIWIIPTEELANSGGAE